MKSLIYIIIITVFLALIFFYNPRIDIFVSKLFFSQTQHDFFLQNNPIIKTISTLTYFIALLFTIPPCIFILKKLLKTKSFDFKLYKKEAFILLVFLIGSILVVHVFAKHYFGRARPYEVHQFGGKLEFSPAFEISNQCQWDCSFVSFHTSIGMLFISYAVASTGRRKMLLTIAAIFLATLFGITRIMQGKHFLSDVIFSAFFMLITTYFLAWLLKIREYTL
jgi:lipid A 4'-phosphatase